MIIIIIITYYQTNVQIQKVSNLQGTVQQANKLLVLFTVQLSPWGARIAIGDQFQLQAAPTAVACLGVQLAQQI